MAEGVVSERGALAGFRQWRRDTVKNLLGKLIWWCERFVVRHSTVPALPVFDANELAWTGLLEANADAIRRECEAVLSSAARFRVFTSSCPTRRASVTTTVRRRTFCARWVRRRRATVDDVR